MGLSNAYNKLFRPEKSWEVKLQLVTPSQALCEVKIKEKARSKAEAEKKATETLKKMLGVVVIDSHQLKK